jgi:hypothetical protein
MERFLYCSGRRPPSRKNSSDFRARSNHAEANRRVRATYLILKNAKYIDLYWARVGRHRNRQNKASGNGAGPSPQTFQRKRENSPPEIADVVRAAKGKSRALPAGPHRPREETRVCRVRGVDARVRDVPARTKVATVFSALLIRSSCSSSEYCERCFSASAASLSAVLLALTFRFLGILNSNRNRLQHHQILPLSGANLRNVAGLFDARINRLRDIWLGLLRPFFPVNSSLG